MTLFNIVSQKKKKNSVALMNNDSQYIISIDWKTSTKVWDCETKANLYAIALNTETVF